jgi:hypothetical protein
MCGMPNAAAIRKLKDHKPDVFVIDLSRLPSQGRDVGLVIRQSRDLRYVPIVFVGGLPDKIQTAKKHLPDAVYTVWDSIETVVKNAIANPPENPVVPPTALDGYSSAPLPKKLGIKPKCRIMLVNVPSGFKKLIGKLPIGAKYVSQSDGDAHLLLWFVKSRLRLQNEIKTVSKSMAANGGLWICWPKKTSGAKSDLSETTVRIIGLQTGLVDYKICAIDSTWSGLKFARRTRS